MKRIISTRPTLATGKAMRIVRRHGGIIRTAEAMRLGIHPRTLRQLLDGGNLERLSRGVYHAVERGPVSNPDLAVIATRVPRGVVCLVSALAFHNLTTQVPHAVSVALPRGASTPRVAHPPVEAHRFSDRSLAQGVERRRMDGVTVLVFNAEKTLADCFKFRNKIGMDVVLEALRLYRARRDADYGRVLRFARVCRVERVMRPYLEALA